MASSVKTAYWWSVHIILAVLIMHQIRPIDLVDKLFTKASSIKTAYYYKQLGGFYQRQATQFSQPVSLFVGDSLVQGWHTNNIASNAVNFGIGKDTIKGLTKRLPAYMKQANVQQVIVLIGINDLLNQSSNATIQRQISQLAHQLDTGTPIYWLGVLPVANRVPADKIIALNRLIEQTCTQLRACHYMHPSNELSEPDFSLKSHFHVGDGLHLNSHGYQVLSHQLKDLLLKNIAGKGLHYAK